MDSTLCSKLTYIRPPTDTPNKTSVIYSIHYECKHKYIDKTRKDVSTRMNEHKKNVKQGKTTKSKLAVHSLDNKQKFKFNDLFIICTEPRSFEWKFNI